MKKVIAGIVAGGKGTRMGNTPLPKQFLEIGGKPILIHTVCRFIESCATDYIVIGTNADYLSYTKELVEKYFSGKENVYVVAGGPDRNATVANIIDFAVNSIGASDDDIIITHDAVRPYVSCESITESVAAMKYCDVCTAAVPATDTIAVSEDGKRIDAFPERKTIFLVQTPQTFTIGAYKDVCSTLSTDEISKATDVCSLFRMTGRDVNIIPGDYKNIKITYSLDLG